MRKKYPNEKELDVNYDRVIGQYNQMIQSGNCHPDWGRKRIERFEKARSYHQRLIEKARRKK